MSETLPGVESETADAPAALDRAALLDEALKKSGLIWAGPAGGPERPVWHVWDGGAIYLLCGGGEQPQPVRPGEPAVVVIRSKDNQTRLATTRVAVTEVPPGEEWDRITAIMLTKRLNLPDGEAAPRRWAEHSTLLELIPAGDLIEGPGHYDPAAHAEPPLPTAAGTRVPRPWHLFGRGPSGR